jgi:Ca-activated chloride channel family protein
MRVDLLGVLCAALFAQAPTATSPVFPTVVEAVKVTVVVSDPRGEWVRGLSRDDFRILEDGRPQKVTLFSPSDEVEVAGDEFSVGLLVDTSGSMARARERAYEAALRFLQKLPLAQVRLVASFDAEVRFWDVGRPADILLGQMRAASRKQGPTALYDALDGALQRIGTEARGAIVVMTDGEDFGSKATRREVLQRIDASNVTVYPIGFRGESGESGWQFLEQLARWSGGLFYDGENRSFEMAFQGIGAELTSQYLLGYVPDRPQGPGFHRLKVEVARPGLRVRHRPGYAVGKPR